MLKVEKLEAFYGKAQALSDVSFEIEKGEIVCIIGNNGAGKSTTLMSISGVIKQKKGSIIWDNEDISQLPPHRIVSRGISQVPEGRHIFPTLNVEENLRMGAFLKRRIPKEKFDEIYELFPVLFERRRQLGGSLSGGEQQMLAISRAMMGDVRMMMLDEPSLGLAPQIIDTIFDSIVRLRESGMTILLIEQNAELALDISDRGYVMELGKTVMSGSSKEMKNDEKIQSIYFGQQLA